MLGESYSKERVQKMGFHLVKWESDCQALETSFSFFTLYKLSFTCAFYLVLLLPAGNNW